MNARMAQLLEQANRISEDAVSAGDGAQVQVFKIDDPNMPADFLTKWLPQLKLRDSVAYATNSANRVSSK